MGRSKVVIVENIDDIIIINYIIRSFVKGLFCVKYYVCIILL